MENYHYLKGGVKTVGSFIIKNLERYVVTKRGKRKEEKWGIQMGEENFQNNKEGNTHTAPKKGTLHYGKLVAHGGVRLRGVRKE